MSDKIKFLDQLSFIKNTELTSNRAFFDINDAGELEVSGTTTLPTSGVRITGNNFVVDNTATFNGLLTTPAGTGIFAELLSGLNVSGPNPTTPFTPEGTGTHTPNAVIQGTLQVSGDIIAGGTIGAIDRDDLRVADNKILLNVGEVGPGVTAGSAGIIVIRDDSAGTTPHSALVWEEATASWNFNFGIPQDITEDTPIGAQVPLPVNPRLINIGEPVNPQDVSTKNYADTSLGAFVSTVVLTDLNDVIISSPVESQMLKYSSGNWINDAIEVEELSNVGAAVINGFFRWDGTGSDVVYQTTIDATSGDITNLSTVATSGLLKNLDDVAITTPLDKKTLILTGSGTVWQEGYSDKLTDDDADTFISVSDTDDTVNITAGPDGGDIILTPGTASSKIQIAGAGAATITSDSGISLESTSAIAIHGLNYPSVDGSLGELLSTDGSGELSFITPTLANLGDFNITNPQDQERMVYDFATSKWVNAVADSIQNSAATSFVAVNPSTDDVVVQAGLGAGIILDAGDENVIISGGAGNPGLGSDTNLEVQATTDLFLSAGIDVFIQGYTFPKGAAPRSAGDVLVVDGSSNLSWQTLGLNYLNDVDVTTSLPNDNEVLTYIGGDWVPAVIPHPTGPSTVLELTDTNNSVIANGYLRWNAGANQVVYETTIPLASLESAVTTDDVLTWNGTAWAPAAAQLVKPGYTAYLATTGAGPYNLTGNGANNTSGSTAGLQVFVDGLYMIHGVDYTLVIGTPGNITLISPPGAAFNLVIYEF